MNSTSSPMPTSAWWNPSLSRRQTVLGLGISTAVILIAAALSYTRLAPSGGFDGPRPGSSSSGGAGGGFAGAFSIPKDAFKLIPRDEIHAGGPPKDGIPALTNPKTVQASAAGLAPADRVIGVVIDGEARAYPLRILNWHEIVNDTLGGKPIAVTYCPLCDSAVVFDRTIGGEVREFGVSGLLYNSNVLMYDRQEDEAKESLWSQMMLAAVVGPAAQEGLELELLPAQLTTWESWSATHAKTTSLSFDTGHARNYDGNPYAGYFSSPQLMFPVKTQGEPAPDADALPAKEPTIVVSLGGTLKGYPVSRLRAALVSGAVTDEFAGRRFTFTEVDGGEGLYQVTDSAGGPVPAAFTFWFEFRAAHPKAEVFEFPGTPTANSTPAREQPRP